MAKCNTRPSLGQRLKSTLCGMVLGLVIPSLAFGQAALLPNAKQQYLDDSGNPVATGTVTYYIPSTSTKKTIWQDAAETTIQSNPVLLDAAGRPQPAGQTYGSGSYRQVVKDVNGVTIWDAVTASTGSGGGGSSAQSEGIMVGTIIAWANPVLPAKYLYTAGQAVLRATYPDLFTALTFQQNIICVSGISTVTVTTAVSDSVPIGAKIEAACFPAGTTVSSKVSGQLTMSNLATATTSVASVIFPWGNGNGTTTFNVPDLRGRVMAGRDNMGGAITGRLSTAIYGSNPDAIDAAGGGQSKTLITANLPAYTPSGNVGLTDPGHTHTATPSPTNAFTSTDNQGLDNALGGSKGYHTQSVSISSATTGISASFGGIAQGGTSTPFSVVQPTLTSDFIIKALADDLPTGPGVTSIQGMTGALSCGAGLTCTAQTISAGNAVAIDVGVTQVLDGSTTNILYNNAGILGEYGVASNSDFTAGTANKVLTTGTIWQAETTTTYGTTTTFDFNTFKNTKVTLTGNITTMTLTNVKAGQSGMITFIQDGSGSRTSVWSTVFKFAGGTTPTLTTTAAAVDILNFSCRTTTFCEASLMADVK